MDVREKLVELICSTEYGNGSLVGNNFQKGFIEKIASHLIANDVTVQEWVSVKDRLPEDGQSVLTCKNGVYDIQTYEERRNGWLCKGWFWSMATVTHWMPIPQPPKGE